MVFELLGEANLTLSEKGKQGGGEHLRVSGQMCEKGERGGSGGNRPEEANLRLSEKGKQVRQACKKGKQEEDKRTGPATVCLEKAWLCKKGERGEGN